MKFIKYLKYIFNLPIYYLSIFYPRHKNIWVLGAWVGNNYSDNSKYLHKYLCESQKGIRAIWLTTDKDILQHLRCKGYEVYLTYSWQGYLYSLKAGVGVYCVSKYDLNIFTTGGIKLVNLWHGTPLKKILQDDNITYKNTHPLTGFVFPFLLKKPELLTAASEIVQGNMASAFLLEKEKIKITGYPRNDVFYQHINEKKLINERISKYSSSGIKTGIYMPTHRGEGSSEIIKYFNMHIEELNAFLKDNRIVLLVKLHFYDLKGLKIPEAHAENIIFVENAAIDNDIYSIIHQMDFLITDYSSIFFDFLLSDKPIIFFPFDYDQYLKKDRSLYYDYQATTPGEKAYSWAELKQKINEALQNPSKFKEQRAFINDQFNTYRDGQNSERVFQEIMSLV